MISGVVSSGFVSTDSSGPISCGVTKRIRMSCAMRRISIAISRIIGSLVSSSS